MPFGEKKDLDGNPINFDMIDKDFIKSAVAELGIECVRCDEFAEKETYLYELVNISGKQVGIITGDIQNIKEIEFWVNSENINTQMARHFERSISATSRFLGAKKDRAGHPGNR